MTIRVALRTTARISFVLFLGAFLGNALYALVPIAATRWLKANKNAFTLGFAGSHTLHLMFILTLVAAIGREHVFKGWMAIAFTANLVQRVGFESDCKHKNKGLNATRTAF